MMGCPRLHVAAPPERAPERLTASAALIRSRIAYHRAELDEHRPEAVDLAAESLAAGHSAAWGRMAELRGSRTARYREAQLAGEHGLPLEDIACIALEAPDVARALLAPLVMAVGCRMEPLVADVGGLADEAADVAESGGRLSATITRALDDGRISPEEAAAIDAELTAHELEVSDLRAAVAQTRRVGK